VPEKLFGGHGAVARRQVQVPRAARQALGAPGLAPLGEVGQGQVVVEVDAAAAPLVRRAVVKGASNLG
jgi:hypothetical protein